MYISSRLHGFTSKKQALFTVLSVRTSNFRHKERWMITDCRVQRGKTAGHGGGSVCECGDNNTGIVCAT
jgi:hypothetical protein